MDFNSLASPYQFSVQLLWFSAFRCHFDSHSNVCNHWTGEWQGVGWMVDYLLLSTWMVGTGILNCLCVTWKAGRARLLIWAWTTTFCSLPSSSSSPARGEPLNGSQDATEAHTHGGESSSSGFHPSYWTQHKRKPPDYSASHYYGASPLFPRGTLLGKDGGDGIARAARIRVARSSGIDLPRRWNTAKNR